MIDVCERCHEPLGESKGRKPGLCVDCTADDFGGYCEECGEEVALTEHTDGLCPACVGKGKEFRAAENREKLRKYYDRLNNPGDEIKN